MYQSRSERIKKERTLKQKRIRRLRHVSGVLFALAIVFAAVYGGTKLAGLIWNQGNQAPATPPPEETGTLPATDPEVHLSFVGDVMMSGNVENRLKEKGYDFPYTYVRSLFQQDDYTIANLETPVTARGKPADNKEYVYKSPPEAIPELKAAGVDLVNLANNHSMDQGEEGLLDTFQALDANKIEYVGAGANAERAYSPVYVERNGITFAVFGFSRVVPDTSWYAGKNKPGVAITYDPKRAVEAIRSAKAQADLVVVVTHWGKERVDEPVDHQVELAHAYIDAGADLVVGGHPHVLQGFEKYKDKWIAYSLGNFIFTRATVPKTWETMVLQASCKKTGDCALKMLPYYTELGQPVPMDDETGAKLLQRIESISRDVRIHPDGRVVEQEK